MIIHREHYPLAKAADNLKCEVSDLIRLGATEKIHLHALASDWPIEPFKLTDDKAITPLIRQTYTGLVQILAPDLLRYEGDPSNTDIRKVLLPPVDGVTYSASILRFDAIHINDLFRASYGSEPLAKMHLVVTAEELEKAKQFIYPEESLKHIKTYLLHRKHPDALIIERKIRLEIATVPDLSRNAYRGTRKATKMPEEITAYKQLLNGLTKEDLTALYEQEKAREVEEMRLKAEFEKKAQFFNHPSATADTTIYAHFAKLAVWTLDEAVALSLGKNPRVVYWKRIVQAKGCPFTKQYRDLMELAQRAKGAGQLADPVSPSVFLEWASRLEIETPPELCALLGLFCPPVAGLPNATDSTKLAQQLGKVGAASPKPIQAMDGTGEENRQGLGRKPGETTKFWEYVNKLIAEKGLQDCSSLWDELKNHVNVHDSPIVEWHKTSLKWKKADLTHVEMSYKNFRKRIGERSKKLSSPPDQKM